MMGGGGAWRVLPVQLSTWQLRTEAMHPTHFYSRGRHIRHPYMLLQNLLQHRAHVIEIIHHYIQINIKGVHPKKIHNMMKMTKWHCLTGGSGRDSKRDIPREFKDANEVMAVMANPLLNEGLSSLNGDYHSDKYSNERWNRDLYQLRLTKLTEGELCRVFLTFHCS